MSIVVALIVGLVISNVIVTLRKTEKKKAE